MELDRLHKQDKTDFPDRTRQIYKKTDNKDSTRQISQIGQDRLHR